MTRAIGDHGTMPPPSGPKNRWIAPTGVDGLFEVHLGGQIIGYVLDDDLAQGAHVRVWRVLAPGTMREVDLPYGSREDAARAVLEWHETWEARYVPCKSLHTPINREASE